MDLDRSMSFATGSFASAPATYMRRRFLVCASNVTNYCGGVEYDIGVDATASLCWQATRSGETGLHATGGLGGGGIGMSGRSGFSVSNAQSLTDFSRGFTYVSAGVGEDEVSVGGSYPGGSNACGRGIWQAQGGRAPGLRNDPLLAPPVSVAYGRSWTAIGR